MRSTDAHAARRIARVLHEFGGRRALDQRAAEPARKADALAVDRRPRVFPDREGFRVVAEIDPRLLEDAFRVVLDRFEALFAQYLVRRHLAGDIWDDRPNRMRTGRSTRLAAASTRTRPTGLAHARLPFERVPGAESKDLLRTWYIPNI